MFARLGQTSQTGPGSSGAECSPRAALGQEQTPVNGPFSAAKFGASIQNQCLYRFGGHMCERLIAAHSTTAGR
ncbi:hypothetical protein C4F17_30555 [Variovorax sp. PMC12]|nr:hypothetical protein C4F17_30555 [Variovorax sp. PMC12]